MQRRHLRLLAQMQDRPTPADVRWAEVESLLGALGVEIHERSGSRVQLVKGRESIVVHKPHPRPELRRDTVRDIVAFIGRILNVEDEE